MNICDVDRILTAFRGSTYICSLCGNIVFPEVTIDDDKVEIIKESGSITGGRGGQTLRDRVCRSCIKNIDLGFQNKL